MLFSSGGLASAQFPKKTAVYGFGFLSLTEDRSLKKNSVVQSPKQ
jgi:hypothetical protein